MTPPSQKSFAGKGVFPSRYAFTLLLPLRNIFLSPRTLIQRLNIREDDTILEIGPGPGYFSTHVARTLKKGRLVLLDIQQEMLDISRKRLEKRNIHNVDYVLTNGRRLELADNTFHTVFMVTVLGEVENQEDYLKEIHRVLKDGGTLSISELAGDPDKISMEELKSLVCPFGFRVGKVFGTRLNYTMNFQKRGQQEEQL